MTVNYNGTKSFFAKLVGYIIPSLLYTLLNFTGVPSPTDSLILNNIYALLLYLILCSISFLGLFMFIECLYFIFYQKHLVNRQGRHPSYLTNHTAFNLLLLLVTPILSFFLIINIPYPYDAFFSRRIYQVIFFTLQLFLIFLGFCKLFDMILLSAKKGD